MRTMQYKTMTRRKMVATLALGASAVITARRALGNDAPKLDPTDPKAAALGYVTDAARVDTKKYPAFVPGSNCENCLQLEGSAGNSYRPCSLFPGSVVAVKGWCSGWAAEM
jgi:hypothetical protein